MLMKRSMAMCQTQNQEKRTWPYSTLIKPVVYIPRFLHSGNRMISPISTYESRVTYRRFLGVLESYIGSKQIKMLQLLLTLPSHGGRHVCSSEISPTLAGDESSYETLVCACATMALLWLQ